MEKPGWIRRAETWLQTDGRLWVRRFLLALVAIAILVALSFVAAAFLPRWWSHRVAGQVSGSMTVGIVLGLFYGFVFTVLPLGTVLRAFRKRRPWKIWGALAALAVLLAAPNLLTLSIVVGSNKAAHAGERTLDVDAPGFRGASLAGAIVGLLALLALEYLLVTRRWSRRKLDAARRPT